METPKNEKTNDLTNEEYFLALLLLLEEDERQQKEKWDQFEKDLIYTNRFSSKSPVVAELHDCAERAAKKIPSNSVFYRARVYPYNSYDKLLRYYMKSTGHSSKEIDEFTKSLSDSEKLLSLQSQYYSNLDACKASSSKTASNLQQKWKNNVRFKGYSAIESTAPKSNLVGNGRANPDHIRYLYLCEDDRTPVYEIRPIIGDIVSVAEFRLLKDIIVYDLTLDIQDQMRITDNQWSSLYDMIGKMFSKPFNGEVQHYLPTQFLAEEIKRMGFDGLRFNSSLHKGGVNVVLFNPELCKAVSSDLRLVNGISLDIVDPPIYQIGQETSIKED